ELLDPVNLLQVFLLLNSLFWRSYISSSLWVLLGALAAIRKALLARRSQQHVRQLLLAANGQQVFVLRSKSVAKISSAGLVPGDVVLLQQGAACPADVLLLRGSAVVDQADFTGEAAPVEKVPLEAAAQQQTEAKGPQLLQGQTAAERLVAAHPHSLVHAGEPSE
ncbi:P-Type cation-transporting ATPase, putative, partial [Eimeria tenella]